jgi:uncharacterized protein (TIGR02118 family)
MNLERRNPVAQLIALYKTPKDAKAFDAYYYTTHVPLAKKIPGLQKYEVSEGGVGGPGGGAYHLVALLSFNSAADIGAGRRSRQFHRWRGGASGV